MIEPYTVFFVGGNTSEDHLIRAFEIVQQYDFKFESQSADEISTDQIVAEHVLDGGSTTVDFAYDLRTTLAVTPTVAEEKSITQASFSATISLDGTAGVKHEQQMIEDRLGLLVEIVTDLVPLVEPEYSWGMSSHPDMENGAIVPTERPIAESIDRFSWVTVLGPSLVEDFGGREHVLAAPADRVVKLETNHILLVRTDQFFEYDTRDTALEEYLLEDPR